MEEAWAEGEPWADAFQWALQLKLIQRHGCPTQLRARVWPHLLGFDMNSWEEAESLYAKLRQLAASAEAAQAFCLSQVGQVQCWEVCFVSGTVGPACQEQAASTLCRCMDICTPHFSLRKIWLHNLGPAQGPHPCFPEASAFKRALIAHCTHIQLPC
eukprot:809676-Pelagomonas_calceolata.AAC.2